MYDIKPFHMKVTKPWGHEEILSPPNSPVTSKILYITVRHRFSLQYHEVKEEVLTLVKGQAVLYLGKEKDSVEKQNMVLGMGYLVKKNVIHRCEAITDCEIFESSTPEAGTTVRLEDDYSRNNETEEARKGRESESVYTG